MHGKDFFKLEELARASGISARTIRYYVQRGLLPSPEFRGRDTAYDASHLLRLRAIRRFQEAFFPLDAIAARLAHLSEAELERVAEGELSVGPAPLPSPSDAHETPAAHHARPPSHRSLRAIDLADGLSLLVDDDAPAASRRLVDEILAMLQRKEGRR